MPHTRRGYQVTKSLGGIRLNLGIIGRNTGEAVTGSALKTFSIDSFNLLHNLEQPSPPGDAVGLERR